MFKKLRFYAIMLLLLDAIALFVLFIITCAQKRKMCWGFLAAAIVEGLSGEYLLALLGHETRSERRAEEFLDAEFVELEKEDAELAAALGVAEPEEA